MEQSLTIGKVARMAEVSAETLRFYERKGLIDTPSRSPSGYRLYPKSVVGRVRFIKSARELQFSLSEIQLLLQGAERNPTDCQQVKRVLQDKVQELERRLSALRNAQASLSRLIATCTANGACDICRVITQGRGDDDGPA